MLKRIVILACSILIVLTFCCTVFAADVFETGKYNITDSTVEKPVMNFFSGLIDVVQVFTVGLTIIIMIVLAIKYMNAAPEGKAEIKKQMVLYGIGAVIIFSAATLVEIIQKFFEVNLESQT